MQVLPMDATSIAINHFFCKWLPHLMLMELKRNIFTLLITILPKKKLLPKMIVSSKLNASIIDSNNSLLSIRLVIRARSSLGVSYLLGT